MIRSLVFLAVWLFSAAAYAEECSRLRPGDNYKELSAILECQEQRIKALELANDRAGPSLPGIAPPIAADGVWTRGKCFPYEPKQRFKITITIEDSEDQIVLCWKDGIAIAKLGRVKESEVEVTDPAGHVLRREDTVAIGCRYNRKCFLEFTESKMTLVPQMLVGAGAKRAKLTIENHPL